MVHRRVSAGDPAGRDIVNDYDDSRLGLRAFAESIGVSLKRLQYWLHLALVRRSLREARPNASRP